MRSFAVTKERHTSWLGVGTLEMAGQKNVCRNSYCLQRNLRVSLQFCQRQANCIAHCCPCLSSLLVVAVVIVCRCRSSSFVLCVHLCRRCWSSSSSVVVVHCFQISDVNSKHQLSFDCCLFITQAVSLFVIVVGLRCCCWLSSVVIVSCRCSLLLLFIIVIVRRLSR